MVSVIIPTYNRSRMAVEAIRSVLSQTYTGYEIIVVDDASGDDTAELIEKNFRDAISYGILRYFRNEQHRERSFSRNCGIKEARGDFIAFLDDDDLFMPMHLKTCLAVMPTAEVAVTGVIITDSRRQPIGRNSYLFAGKLNSNELALLGLGIGGSNVCLRREIIDKAGLFREDMNCAEDIDFFMRVAMSSSILYLKKETVLRQKHGSHYTYDRNKMIYYRYLRGLKSILLKNADYFSYPLAPKVKGYLHLYLAWNSIFQFRKNYTIKCLMKGIRIYPRLLLTEPFVLFVLGRMLLVWNRKGYIFLKRMKQLCLKYL